MLYILHDLFLQYKLILQRETKIGRNYTATLKNILCFKPITKDTFSIFKNVIILKQVYNHTEIDLLSL